MITLTGTVRRPIRIFGHGTCQLDDGTGKLTTITAGKSRTPGRKAAIRGTLRSSFNMGAKTMPVLVKGGAREKPKRK